MDRKTAEAKARALVGQMTLREKASQLRFDSPAIERLGIPAYNWWNEALHGVARGGTATSFPQAIGLAAMFDDALVKKLVAVAMEDVMLRAPGAWATAEAARVPALIEQKLSSSALSAVCEEVKAFAAIRDRRETLLSGCAVLEGDLMKVAPETWDKALALLQ